MDTLLAPDLPPSRSNQRRGYTRRGERGFVLVFFALGAVLLAGLIGFAVDLGNWYLSIQKAQNAADAASLDASPYLPGDFAQAQSVVETTLNENGIDPANAHIAATNTSCSGGQSCAAQVAGDPSEIHVQVKIPVRSMFIQLLGAPTSINFTRTATAGFSPGISTPIANYSNVLGSEAPPPCGCDDFPESWGDVDYVSNAGPFGPINDPYNQNFRLQIDGANTSKANGDRYSTQNCSGVVGVSPHRYP